jgi:hypothetical protein
MSDRALSILIHGGSGAGKTTFSTTGPKPLLLLDVEMASRFVRGKKIKWNPLTDAPPVADGSWEICVVTVDTFDKALKAYEWLKSRNHPFKTVVVDSISELQAKAIEKIRGRQQLQTQDWGKLLSSMAFFCRDLRDLTGDDDNIIEAVIITAMSKDYDGIIKPYLQGQVSAQIPYWLDITAYLYVDQAPDANGELTDRRNLLIGNHPNYEAKSRVPGLPVVITNPNVSQMLNDIFGEDVQVITTNEVAALPAAEELATAGTGMPQPPSM